MREAGNKNKDAEYLLFRRTAFPLFLFLWITFEWRTSSPNSEAIQNYYGLVIPWYMWWDGISLSSSVSLTSLVLNVLYISTLIYISDKFVIIVVGRDIIPRYFIGLLSILNIIGLGNLLLILICSHPTHAGLLPVSSEAVSQWERHLRIGFS